MMSLSATVAATLPNSVLAQNSSLEEIVVAEKFKGDVQNVLVSVGQFSADGMQQEQLSQEFPLSGAGFDGRMDWLVGAFAGVGRPREDSINVSYRF